MGGISFQLARTFGRVLGLDGDAAAVAAAQQASYERCKRIPVKGRLEDEETMRKQRTEISELTMRLQQQ